MILLELDCLSFYLLSALNTNNTFNISLCVSVLKLYDIEDHITFCQALYCSDGKNITFAATTA